MRRLSILVGAILLMVQLQPRAALSAPNWSVYRDVQYGLTNQEKADLYLLNRGVNPVVVMIHGGGWQAGDKSYYAGYYARLYAMAGFHVVAINYRLASFSDPTTQWNAQLQDTQLAIRWLRQYASVLRIDPSRIGAVGDSSGAHLAVFLGSLAGSANGDRSALYPTPEGFCGRRHVWSGRSYKSRHVSADGVPGAFRRSYLCAGSHALSVCFTDIFRWRMVCARLHCTRILGYGRAL